MDRVHCGLQSEGLQSWTRPSTSTRPFYHQSSGSQNLVHQKYMLSLTQGLLGSALRVTGALGLDGARELAFLIRS